MNWMLTAANIIGVIAIAENFFIYLSTKRENILKLKIASDLMWTVNLYLTGALTGAILDGLAMLRDIIFLQRGKRKWADSPVWPILFMLLILVSPTVAMVKAGKFILLEMFPAVGSLLFALGLWQKNTLSVKYLALTGTILWTVYSLWVRALTGTLNNFVLLASTTIGIVREYRRLKQEREAAESADAFAAETGENA